MSPTIRFDDGDAYEATMGRWSEIVGTRFLQWLAPPPGVGWLDIGCGTGVFSRMILERCTPAVVTAIDPSQAQLDHARRIGPGIHFHLADAQALPFPDASFDQAVMALVIHFLPDPAKGVAEMARVLRPGGTASAYAWHAQGGGSPFTPVIGVLEGRGHTVPAPPSSAVSSLTAMRSLWEGAGFTAIETTEIVPEMRFDSFDTYWAMMRRMPRVGPLLNNLEAAESRAVQAELLARVAPDSRTPFTTTGHANAIRGHRPL